MEKYSGRPVPLCQFNIFESLVFAFFKELETKPEQIAGEGSCTYNKF